MNGQPEISASLRRTLLLKIISKTQVQNDDIDSIIELTASKIVHLLQAQSMTFYLVQGDKIRHKYIYHSPTLQDIPEKAEKIAEIKQKLLEQEFPIGTGIVGKCIENQQPAFFSSSRKNTRPVFNPASETGFEIYSMLTVPLIGNRCIGAIQVVNKELDAPTREFRRDDLKILQEVAEYTAPLIQRYIDPSYVMADDVTAKYIARFTDYPLILNADEIDIDDNLLDVVGDAIIQRTKIFPYKLVSTGSVAVLMINPYDYPSRESFTTYTELNIEEISVAPENLMASLLKEYFNADATSSESLEGAGDIAELADIVGAEFDVDNVDVTSEELDDEVSAPVIQIASRVIEDAYIAGASDIHVEPQENDLLVRYRIDGICVEKLRLPKVVAGALIARFKVMSELDIAEKRLPQDGRIIYKKFTKRKIDIDLRVATGPMNFGEKIVMRILDKSKSALPITALGFSEYNLEKYRECIKQPYGMILHCGPTGSGKSMTLFSAMREIADPTVNIQTAEDPIEYTIPGINQMQMHKQIGLDFARALRAYLRMDPDIILVGEIRDVETAEIAVEAALTGHLLLSTLHTNDAPSTIARFKDMNIEPFMISASILVVCAQRLVRRVCKHCKISYIPEGNEMEIIRMALEDPDFAASVFKASDGGCAACGGNGYKGRIGIHELMTNCEDLIRVINDGSDTASIKKVAMLNGMKTLHQDSILKVKEATTSVIEAISNVPPDIIKLIK